MKIKYFKFIKMESKFKSSSLVGFIDSHCHLQYFKQEELKKIISKCKENNINFLLSNSTCKDDFENSIQISQNFPEIIAGLGHHPWYLENIAENDLWFEEFKLCCEKLESQNINYFVGEIGIDGGKPKK